MKNHFAKSAKNPIRNLKHCSSTWDQGNGSVDYFHVQNHFVVRGTHCFVVPLPESSKKYILLVFYPAVSINGSITPMTREQESAATEIQKSLCRTKSDD